VDKAQGRPTDKERKKPRRIAAAPAQAARGQVRGTAHVGRFYRPTASPIHVGEPGRACPRAPRPACRAGPTTRRDPTTRLVGPVNARRLEPDADTVRLILNRLILIYTGEKETLFIVNLYGLKPAKLHEWTRPRLLARRMGPGRPGTLCLTGGPGTKAAAVPLPLPAVLLCSALRISGTKQTNKERVKMLYLFQGQNRKKINNPSRHTIVSPSNHEDEFLLIEGRVKKMDRNDPFWSLLAFCAWPLAFFSLRFWFYPATSSWACFVRYLDLDHVSFLFMILFL